MFATSLYFFHFFFSWRKGFSPCEKDDSLMLWGHRSHGSLSLKQGASQSVILRPAALASPWTCWKCDCRGPLWPTQSESLELELRKMCYSKFSRWFSCTSKFKNDHSTWSQPEWLPLLQGLGVIGAWGVLPSLQPKEDLRCKTCLWNRRHNILQPSCPGTQGWGDWNLPKFHNPGQCY